MYAQSDESDTTSNEPADKRVASAVCVHNQRFIDRLRRDLVNLKTSPSANNMSLWLSLKSSFLLYRNKHICYLSATVNDSRGRALSDDHDPLAAGIVLPELAQFLGNYFQVVLQGDERAR